MLDAVTKGATFVPATVKPGELYWKLIRADGPEWWDGKHSIFVDVWGEDGFRRINQTVMFSWPGGNQVKVTESKHGEPFAVDFPMFNARPAFSTWVYDRIPSDELRGLGLVPHERHVCYKLVFQLTRAEAADAPVISPPPTPGKPSKVKLYLDDVLVFER